MRVGGGTDVLSTAPQFARIAQKVEARPNVTCETGGYVVPTHFYNPKLPSELRRLAEFIGGCGAGRFYLSLEPNGDIFPCVFFPHEESIRVGNLFKDDFEDIWRHSELLWALRDKDKLAPNCGCCQYDTHAEAAELGRTTTSRTFTRLIQAAF